MKILIQQKWCLISRKRANYKRQIKVKNKTNKLNNNRKSPESQHKKNLLPLLLRLVQHTKATKQERKLLIWKPRKMLKKESRKKINKKIKYKEMPYQIIQITPKLKTTHQKKLMSEINIHKLFKNLSIYKYKKEP